MSYNKKLITVLCLIVIAIAAILCMDAYRLWKKSHDSPAVNNSSEAVRIEILIYGKKIGTLTITDLLKLKKYNFNDSEEKKLQEGWLLKDIIKLYVKDDGLQKLQSVLLSSSIRNKSAEVSMNDILNESYMLLLAASKRGTLKFVSDIKGLDTREKWVQDIDRIELKNK